MSTEGFSWSSLGGNSGYTKQIEELKKENAVMAAKIDMLIDTVNDLKSQLVKIPYDVESAVMRVSRNTFDEHSVTSFLSLDDLEIESEERPDSEQVLEEIEVTVVSGSLTAPAPNKEVKDNFDNLTDEEVADKVLDNLNHYLDENGPLMNAHLKLRGIIPKEYSLSKKSKSIIKERVGQEGSEIRQHKLDRIRGFYYKPSNWSDETPEQIYDKTLRNK